MTLPSAPQIGTTGVIQQPGIAEQIAPFIQMLMQKEQLAMEKERLKLEKQKYASVVSQQALERENQNRLGQELLQALLGSETQQITIPAGALPGAGAMPLQVQTLSPIAQAAQRLPSAAVPAFVEQTRDIRAQAAKARQDAADLEAFHAGLQTARPEVRPILAALHAYKQVGLTLSEQQVRDVFPELSGALQVMSAQDLNAITSTMARANIDFGQGRRALGYHQPVPGIPDDLRVPEKGGMLRAPRQQEVQASGYNIVMEREYPIITGLVGETGGLTIPSSLFADMAKGRVTLENIANAFQDPIQRQLVGAVLRFVTAQTFLFSGKQTTNQEFQRFLNTAVPFANDDPATRAQKLSAFQGYVTASRVMSGPASQGSVVLTETLRTAKLMNWNPRIIEALTQQLQDVRQWEKDLRRRNTIFASDDPTDPDAIEDKLDQWDAIIRRQR